MKKFLVLTTALAFAGVSFAQQTQSGVYEVPNFEVPKHRRSGANKIGKNARK
jgi:hypothetical protein